MKENLVIYSLLALGVIACDSTDESLKKDENPTNQNGFNASTSVFEGTWTWLETEGDVEGVQYRKDSLTEGYSIRYKFYDTNGKSGKIQSYKNSRADILYQYEYSDSEWGNPLQKKLILDRMTNSAPETYYWQIVFKQEEKGERVVGHLYLRNAEYFTDACCNGKIEIHFVLTDGPNL